MEEPEFEITACHANRAGVASVTLTHRVTGAVVAVHHIPFEHSYDRTPEEECGRIQAEAARLAERAAAFLRAAEAAGLEARRRAG